MQHTNIHSADNDTLLPLLGSIVLHGTLVAVLFFLPPDTPSFTNDGLQATLISADELAEIEGQIRENARLAEQGYSLGTQSPSTTQPTSTSTNTTQSHNDDLAARQAEFRRQIEEFAAQQDAEAMAALDAHAQSVAQEQRQAEQELKQLRQTAKGQAQREQNNKKQLEEAHKDNQARNQEKEDELRALGGQSGSLSAGDNPTSNLASGTNADKSKSARGGGGSGSIKGALEAHIRAHWNVPSNASGERLSATIKTDASGNVLSVTISGGMPALRTSLESAVRSASPLSPVIGTEFRTFNATFTAE